MWAECTKTPCAYPATTVKIKNISGLTLYWSLNAVQPRVEIAHNATIEVRWPAGSIDCDQQLHIAFWDTAGDDGVIAGTWGWECTKCQ